MSVAPHELATATIMIVDDHESARESMSDILQCAGYRTIACSSALDALRRLESVAVDAIITDLRMPGMDGIEFVRRLQAQRSDVPVVMITAHASVGSAVDAMRHGAFDYIEKPFDVDQLEGVVGRAISDRGAGSSNCSTLASDCPCMIGDSDPMIALRTKIAQVAPTDETVLITGESGTGKELVARSLHAMSHRADMPMVSLNCPALSPQLMESELFGHEQGAFTSADAARVGRFELADGGTILLDEITEIALGLQAKLLRVLQERSYERVGSSESQLVNVRVIATTNRDLQQYVTERQFREDLYFRINVVPIQLAPLRERRTDIPQLTQHFLAAAATRLNRPALQLDSSALDLLYHYYWPGNVRELENLMTRATVLHAAATASADVLSPWLIRNESDNYSNQVNLDPFAGGMSIQEMEQRLIESTLEHFDGHRGQTARALGIGVRTLCNKLRAYGYQPRAKVATRAA
ncbi:MAG: DNA-binding NtrC family response regulator [Pirellulaceae bacterium]|jgi:DNA-binding NtrC family response regulator